MPFPFPLALVNSRHLEKKGGIRNLGIRKRDNMSLVGEEIQNLNFQCDSKQPSESTVSKIIVFQKGKRAFPRKPFRNIRFFCETVPHKSKRIRDLLSRHTDQMLSCWGQRSFPIIRSSFPHAGEARAVLPQAVVTLGWHGFHRVINAAVSCANNQRLSTHVCNQTHQEVPVSRTGLSRGSKPTANNRFAHGTPL